MLKSKLLSRGVLTQFCHFKEITMYVVVHAACKNKNVFKS